MQRKKAMTEVSKEKLEEMMNPPFSPPESKARHPLSEESVSEIFGAEAESNEEETAESAKEVEVADTSHEEKTEVAPTSGTVRRISSKQRRMSLEEYRNTFLQVPRIDDRKPVFVSCEVRDKLDEYVRKLGGRKMSVSGLIENIARQHLEIYSEDFEQWRKL